MSTLTISPVPRDSWRVLSLRHSLRTPTILKSKTMLKSGDIIAFSGYNATSAFINIATAGVPFFSVSHIGIIAEYEGELLLFESTTLSQLPCMVQQKRVGGTQAVRPCDRIDTYSGKVWHYPLYRRLFEHERLRLSHYLVSHIGRSYDSRQAVGSGGFGCASAFISRIRVFDQAADELFCSEYVAGALATVGIKPTDDPAKWNPNRLIRALRRDESIRRPLRIR